MRHIDMPQGDDEISRAIRYLAHRIDELDSRTIRMVPLGPTSQKETDQQRKMRKYSLEKIMEGMRKAIDEKVKKEPPPVDRDSRVLVGGDKESERPDYKDRKDNGQQKDYVVLSEEERRKGFVRPVRRSYKHVGPTGPKNPLRDLTDKEKERYGEFAYVKYEAYPECDSSVVGKFWTQAELDRFGKGCGTVTTMGQALAETYARDPGFYSGTFCCGCGKHLPVGENGEFVWVDDPAQRVGT